MLKVGEKHIMMRGKVSAKAQDVPTEELSNLEEALQKKRMFLVGCIFGSENGTEVVLGRVVEKLLAKPEHREVCENVIASLRVTAQALEDMMNGKEQPCQ